MFRKFDGGETLSEGKGVRSRPIRRSGKGSGAHVGAGKRNPGSRVVGKEPANGSVWPDTGKCLRREHHQEGLTAETKFTSVSDYERINERVGRYI